MCLTRHILYFFIIDYSLNNPYQPGLLGAKFGFKSI